MDAIARAAQRLLIAQEIIADLQLFERWSLFGTPILVGAAAYNLVVAPDIDMEIYYDEPRIEDGFQVLQACALHPRVRRAWFSNRLDTEDMGLYWQVRYKHENGQEWKIDMWSLVRDHPGPKSASMVEPMKQALDPETRRAILEIKEQVLGDPVIQCGSIYIYRAVLEDGVRDFEQFRAWLECNNAEGLTTWRPDEKYEKKRN